MKKKGLIVATIVMVLVLAVSLTTATYAWFTNEGSATVDPINFSVQSASDVMIGVAIDNSFDESKTLTNFVSGDTTFTAGAWGGDSGLGLHISPNVTLAMEKAIYSFGSISSAHSMEYYKETTSGTTGAVLGSAIEWTTTESGAIDNAKYYIAVKNPASSAEYDISGYNTAKDYMTGTVNAYDTDSGTSGNQNANIAGAIPTGINMSNTILRASGEGNDITTGSLQNATAQQDYVNIAFGALASNPNLLGYGMIVYVRPNDSKSTLGLNAAIHVAYNLDNAGWVEYDLYGTNDRNTVKSTGMSAPALPSWTDSGSTVHTYAAATGSVLADRQAGDAYIYIPFYESANGTTTAGTTAADMHQVQLVVYLCGPDEDCVTASTGVSALLTIEFISLQKS